MSKVGRGGRARLASGEPNPVDIHVGGRVCLRRALLGLSQGDLGDRLGLTFQQVQKYERGQNRISASRIFDIARVLNVPVSFFFDDMPDELKKWSPNCGREYGAQAGDAEEDLLGKRETLELVRAYYQITDDGVRRKLYELARRLGKDGAGE